MVMVKLEGTAKAIYEEFMDEIYEEITEAYEDIVKSDVINQVISKVKEQVSEDLVEVINRNYKEGMTTVMKLILGERAARVVTKAVKQQLMTLSNKMLQKAFDLTDELRNEIIGEVFETEAEAREAMDS